MIKFYPLIIVCVFLIIIQVAHLADANGMFSLILGLDLGCFEAM